MRELSHTRKWSNLASSIWQQKVNYNHIKNKIERFEDLNIWQESVNLAVDIYKVLKDCRDYGLKDQMQRSAVSIPSNIAEGFDRQSNNEFIRFLKISKGSCGELRTQLMIAERVELLNNIEDLINTTVVLSSKIQKLISYRESLRK